MDCSTPGSPILQYLLEFAQIHVHWVSDDIKPSYPLLLLLPPIFPSIRVFFNELAVLGASPNSCETICSFGVTSLKAIVNSRLSEFMSTELIVSDELRIEIVAKCTYDIKTKILWRSLAFPRVTLLSRLWKIIIILDYVLWDIGREKIIKVNSTKLNRNNQTIWVIWCKYIIEDFFYGVTGAMNVLGPAKQFWKRHSKPAWLHCQTLMVINIFKMMLYIFNHFICSVKFSHSVVSDSLWLHELEHARPSCPSPTAGVHPNSCPWRRWCHPAISSSVIPFSSCP